MCGEEALINEEISDVPIGTAQFNGDGWGSMLMLGWPGCHGQTTESIEQDE